MTPADMFRAICLCMCESCGWILKNENLHAVIYFNYFGNLTQALFYNYFAIVVLEVTLT